MQGDISDSAKVGIGVLILCFLIGIVLSIFSITRTISSNSANKFQNSVNQFQNVEMDTYNQTTVFGSNVNSAIQLFSNESMAIMIKTAAGNTYYNYGALVEGASLAGTGDNQKAVKNLPANNASGGYYHLNLKYNNGELQRNTNTKPTKESGAGSTFVRDSAKFDSALIKDETGTIVGIVFTQREE